MEAPQLQVEPPGSLDQGLWFGLKLTTSSASANLKRNYEDFREFDLNIQRLQKIENIFPSKEYSTLEDLKLIAQKLESYFSTLGSTLRTSLYENPSFLRFIVKKYDEDQVILVEKDKFSEKDFEALRVIGKGCMGKVFLVRKKSTRRIYAMKVISKEWVLLQRETEHTRSERNLLTLLAENPHPFLVNLHCTFQSTQNLYLVLDYCPGGDLATQLAQTPRFHESKAIFYSAQMVLALEHLHQNGIVYRDLKPENCLIDADGYLVITDLGLSKLITKKSGARTFCGTAEYLAPEILKGDEYFYPVDWWSLGAFLHEMILGETPFYHSNHQELYRRVLTEPLHFRGTLSLNAKNIIEQLLDKNPKTRLGSRLKGVQEIKEHPFFSSINWDDLYYRRITPPWKPSLSGEEDVTCFDEVFTNEKPDLHVNNVSLMLPPSAQDKFKGFSFTNENAILCESALSEGKKLSAKKKELTIDLKELPQREPEINFEAFKKEIMTNSPNSPFLRPTTPKTPSKLTPTRTNGFSKEMTDSHEKRTDIERVTHDLEKLKVKESIVEEEEEEEEEKETEDSSLLALSHSKSHQNLASFDLIEEEEEEEEKEEKESYESKLTKNPVPDIIEEEEEEDEEEEEEATSHYKSPIPSIIEEEEEEE